MIESAWIRSLWWILPFIMLIVMGIVEEVKGNKKR